MYSIAWQDSILELNFHGSIGAAELYRCYGEIAGDPRFDDVRYMLFDYTDATSPEYTTEDMDKFYYLDQASSMSNSRITQVVIAVDENTAAIASYYIHISQDLPWRTLLVRSREEANSLLGELRHQTH